MAEWTETYRGIVKAWECDVFAHLTIAYYYEHYEDASAIALDAFAPHRGPSRTTGLYVRHLREFRAGDSLHIMSAPIASGAGTLTLGHKVFDSANGDLAATVEQNLEFVALDPIEIAGGLVAWDGPARETRPAPSGPLRFVPSGRGIVKAAEVGAAGLGWQHLIHRFSGAGLHACNAIGMTARYLRENQRGFSTFELDLAIKAVPGIGDHLAVTSALVQIGKSSMRLVHRMTDARTGAEVATLGQYGVHFDMEARRPAPLPDELRRKAEALTGGAA
jgi:acyl-CoA thioesterase FadM